MGNMIYLAITFIVGMTDFRVNYPRYIPNKRVRDMYYRGQDFAHLLTFNYWRNK
jgi:hypothetical protein